ncbi:MAG: hypothetical protein A3H79_04090 [Candidatus Levybacteria bacterium RIFCSPLOWO2_02_FULL_36_8b]|nr:MAG: hypothetical protein A3H79_04090 [Candidatus Levybacteria bacterium RIFCSPLOWO2_02_FULL_36_8b]
MTLLELTSISSVILFGTISVFLSKKERTAKKELLDRERNQKQRLYEIAILKEIQERIGYELNVEKVIDVITGSLRNLFPYSTSSSLFVEKDKLVFKTYVEESVNHEFIEQVKKNSLNSLTALVETPLPKEVDESISGVVLDDTNNQSLSSFFHIPLVVNNVIVGLINVSSTKPGLYKEDEMTILYRITNQASNALSRLQQVLDTEKGKLMSLIGSLADGVFMLDVNNQVLVINDAAKKLLKINKDKADILDILGLLPKEYDFIGKIKEATTQNKTIEEKEIAVDGKTVQVFITPVSDKNTNKVIGVSVLLHDITLEKNLSRLKEDFTNMMVHELRSPLTAIKDASSFIVSNADLGKEESEKMLNIVNDQSKVLLEYVSSLLDAAKIEAGRFVIQKKLGDIKNTIQGTVQVFIPVAKTKKVELSAIIDDNLPMVSYDPIRIGQVLNNFLSNSLKFTPEGGKITVSVKNQARGANEILAARLFEPQRVSQQKNLISDLSASPLANEITISVSDTGIGIPKEKQGQLFSKFAQVNQPNGQKPLAPQSGTGLGLYIAKGIIEAHGGSVLLESEEGRGTTISFTLPAETNEAATTVPQSTVSPQTVN